MSFRNNRYACEQWVGADIERTFAFFSNAANLETITPPYLHFRILTPMPIEIREGALIEYRIRLFGAPVHWLTRIEEWEPGRSFTDVQVRGPYALWVHRHHFTAREGGTLVEDHVEYRVPGTPLSAPVHSLFARPTVERIFAHRRRAIERILG